MFYNHEIGIVYKNIIKQNLKSVSRSPEGIWVFKVKHYDVESMDFRSVELWLTVCWPNT